MAERDDPSGAPTLAQSAFVELGLCLVGLVLIVVLGRSVPGRRRNRWKMGSMTRGLAGAGLQPL
jgi:hypothetical protein